MLQQPSFLTSRAERLASISGSYTVGTSSIEIRKLPNSSNRPELAGGSTIVVSGNSTIAGPLMSDWHDDHSGGISRVGEKLRSQRQ